MLQARFKLATPVFEWPKTALCCQCTVRQVSTLAHLEEAIEGVSVAVGSVYNRRIPGALSYYKTYPCGQEDS
jgi:hypothetical protein